MAHGKPKAEIHFDNMNVNVIETTSGIFVGKNLQWNWRVNSKENAGFGTLDGKKNITYQTVNIVHGESGSEDYLDGTSGG